MRVEDILVWLRRDLRWRDNTALNQALRDGRRVHLAVVMADRPPASPRERLTAAAVTTLSAELDALNRAAGGAGAGVSVLHGDPCQAIPTLAFRLGVGAVYAHRDSAPDVVRGDQVVKRALRGQAVAWADFKDRVLVEHGELTSGSGRPYRIFTPYLRRWRQRVIAGMPSMTLGPRAAALQPPVDRVPASPGAPAVAGEAAAWVRAEGFFPRIAGYAAERDFPARAATSGLSVDLSLGTISVRALAARAALAANPGADKWLGELAWRDFYHGLLADDPDLVDHCYQRRFDALAWADWPAGFAAWQRGETGYPIVDAAMRELASRGTMHNRLRMICASFLCKDLGIDWRLGERHFAQHLLDYDLASNNGGWQWSASTGCDAQPWFRIFNPVTQGQRFDPDGAYVRRHLPMLARVPDRHLHAPWQLSPAQQAALGCIIGRDYPPPLVDHASARTRTLARFRAVDGGPAAA